MRVRDTLREMTPMGAPKTETPIGAVDPDTLGPHLAMSEGGAGPKGTPGGQGRRPVSPSTAQDWEAQPAAGVPDGVYSQLGR